MKKTNKKGFTLAELLIVVAIIAVLVAIAIPIFTSQLEKSKEATDLSNVRAAYAEAVAAYISEGETGTYTVKLESNVSDCKTTGNVA
ncbi:MAG: prepilin-type N-terminal cleavage/methylation domain-containing protein, partial [Clostridia bacterium]|nr:prepilin-type N-terminal cleavage/methylation domain-containing protein [Clostridia bacterium]